MIASYRSMELFNIVSEVCLYLECRVGFVGMKGRYDNIVGS